MQRESDSGALLKILGFEILLKCALIVSNVTARFGHKYVRLWNALPDAAKAEILAAANERMPGYADLTNIEKLLTAYQFVFEEARYSYEFYDGYTPEEEHELGEFWLSLGAPVEEAIVRYYPMELTCLIAGLEAYVKRRVP